MPAYSCVNTPMKNEYEERVILSRSCLKALCRDLCDDEAKRLCNQLDRALRLHDSDEFNRLCALLPEIIKQDIEPWRIKEQLQVVSLIRMPLFPLDPLEQLMAQRARVSSRTMSLNPSDKLIFDDAGTYVTDILRRALKALRPTDFKHGPGVTQESSSAEIKRRVVWIAPDVLRRFSRFLPDYPWRHRPGSTRTLLVPKDHKSLRTIAAEPTWTQWCQQGVMASLMRVIERDPISRGHIAFRDQEVQRSLLREPDIATIDLSDASDTLRVKHFLLLVKDLEVRQSVLSLRSTSTRFRNFQLPTQAMFPMGAATCFPFETLVFASLMLAWVAAETGNRLNTWGVFGDDIIIPSYLAGGFCAFLRRAGFSPNMNKTFISGHFFESCGTNLYKGVDVTPIKIKKSAPSTATDLVCTTYESYTTEASKRGYSNLATLLRSLVPFPEKTRWNRDLYRMEQLGVSSTVRTRTSEFSYIEALLGRSGCVPYSDISSKLGWLPQNR